MSPLRIATWNINSVRLRIGLVERFTAVHLPDILCLQETKTPDEFFPTDALAALGYTHIHASGMKSYNGVAILSRLPLKDAGVIDWCGRSDCRHCHAIVETPSGPVALHNLYIPAGGDIPDPEANDKFAHKLDFVDALAEWWPHALADNRRAILVGDLNIAPLEHDVWSHRQLLNVVSHTPIEVEKLNRMQASGRWVDAVRQFHPADQKLYSWWSYRARDWSASDRGRRLDHVWVTPDLSGSLKNAAILREARGWDPKPSDHAPVIVDLDLSSI